MADKLQVKVAIRVYRGDDGELAAYAEGADGVSFDQCEEWVGEAAANYGHGEQIGPFYHATIEIEPVHAEPIDVGTVATVAGGEV